MDTATEEYRARQHYQTPTRGYLDHDPVYGSKWHRPLFASLFRSESLCIKLFDKRCFAISENAIPGGSVWEGTHKPGLDGLQKSEDLVRQEKAIYDRLFFLQGALLPHCYGFFLVCSVQYQSSILSCRIHVLSTLSRFTLPNNWRF